VLVRRGQGGGRREVGMDDWAWGQLSARLELPVGPLFCVIPAPRAAGAGRSPPPAPSCATPRPPPPGFGAVLPRTQLRHAHAVALAHEGVPLVVIQRQVGHSNLGITSVYLRASTAPRSSKPSTPAELP
jgi:integrase